MNFCNASGNGQNETMAYSEPVTGLRLRHPGRTVRAVTLAGSESHRDRR